MPTGHGCGATRGEPLLVVGRQVVIHEINDRIDLLALDRQGNVVVIEIKREDITAPVDIQGLRYASYVSGWKADDLQRVAAEFIGEDEEDFTQFAEFAESEGADEETPLLEADMELKDKMALPSSITIYERKGRRWLILRIKHDYQLEADGLLEFLGAVAKGKLA